MLRPPYSKAYVTNIQAPDCTLQSTTVEIRETFLTYYTSLYTTRATSDLTDQEDYLSKIDLSYLEKHMQEFLAEPFSEEEIKATIESLTSSTAPGLDSFTGEFYKAFKDILAPKLLEMYDEALANKILHPTLREAVIILLPKPGKDPTRCESYRPLSLLNLDYKILAKMIACRLAQLMEHIISPAQSGFVSRRSTSLNLRTLFATIHRINPEIPTAAIILDAEKAFGSLEWPFFSSIMRRMGMPKGFIALTELLHNSPTARLRLNGTISHPFSLSRGTRQGCPLSPLLFILAMDPLVRHLQEDHIRRGLQFNTGLLLISLYANDIILYVRKPQINLDPLIRETIRFGLHSGLHINWSKSVIFPLTTSTAR